MGVLASIGASIVGFLLKKSSLKWIEEVFSKIGKTDDGQVRLAEIAATTQVAMKKEETVQLAALLSARVALQQAKMNWPIFWVLIAAMMGPPLLMTWGVTIYNFLWWEHGLWPQSWAIADFPPSIKPWIQASIDWLYDPLGQATNIGSALVAGKVAGRR